MFDKLEAVEKRYQDLEGLLADPDVIGKRAEFQKLSKERADIVEIVETFRELKKVVAELDANKPLLEEKDPEMKAMAREESARLGAEQTRLEEKLKVLLLPKDKNDDKNIVLEIRGGTGGEEAALFAADLFRMYSRYAERHRWKLEVLSQSDASAGGLKEVIVLISSTGGKVYSALKYESGVHRVQRVPATETQGRIHTSAATVVVLPEVEEVDIKIEEKDLEIKVSRSGGPGGQSVNTTDSAVQILHKPSGIQVRCQDEKSQHKNKDKAMKILRSKLYEIEAQKQEAAEREARREQVKSGDRSDKIRTYNFPQDRLTDHRIGLTKHNLDDIMDGNLDPIIEALRTHYQAEALQGSQ
ncbi:MAG TPA: peptide chain release factor 1 [Polyangia bacterium]|nr:peptide chain release factor 1 [Polyangia bacterium]